MKEKKRESLDLLPYPAEIEYLHATYGKNNIEITRKNRKMAEESYILEINEDGITIHTATDQGFFYGQQTLKQLIRQFGKRLPCLKIKDKPRYSWRGLHLDVSRHFFGVDTIKKLLRAMSYFKMNRFHWHLTDDQGWRLPVAKYPDLTNIGGWRKEKDGSIYGGVYTKENIKEIIDLAAELYIEVIPEIEMPGHSAAALAAYPQFSCRSEVIPVGSEWGVYKDVYCPGKNKTLKFLKDVIAEVCELFPGRWLHIGGDECPYDNWRKCPDCRKRINEQGLADEVVLQGWMMNEIMLYLTEKGKTSVGWDEILDSNSNNQTVVMIWRGDGKDAQNMALANSQKMIMCSNFYCYFDWKQTSADNEKGSFGVTPLSKTYNYVLCETPDPGNLVLGLQGNIWTERIRGEEELFYMAFPRALAIAERGWSEKIRKFSDFSQRVRKQSEYLRGTGITPCGKIE